MRAMRAAMTRADGLVLGLIATFGIVILGTSLHHPFIPLWDEGMHQAAARGTFDTPLYPHIYVESLPPYDPHAYWASQVWLNKPPAPFWFAAAVMHVLGVTPLALRLGSLLGMIAAAGVIYLLGRDAAGRFLAALFALVFLSLPFGWLQTQGLYFGDVTDCTLVGCNALAIWLLVRSVERQSWKLSAAAGAMVGLGILCKAMLAVTPLGVAVGLWLVTRKVRGFQLAAGPKAWWVLVMFAAAAVVALPWNLYAAHTWPQTYWLHARTWLGHLSPVGGETIAIGSWKRPLDGILNEINGGELKPFPAAITLFAGLWLVVRAIGRRDTSLIVLAGWLWSSWLILSYSDSKVPAAAWGVAPAAIIALAVLFRDGFRWPAVGLGTTAALFTPMAIAAFPWLAELRGAVVSAKFDQTRFHPGLFEGVFLIAVGLAAGLAITRLVRWRAPLMIPSAIALAVLVINTQAERKKLEADNAPRLWVAYSQELGLAVDPVIPKKSVLFQDFERDMGEGAEVQAMIFWSGRMTHRGLQYVPLARERGYHPYLVSPAAEPYAPVAGVPPHAWLRAYDLEQPAAPAPLPAGVVKVGAQFKQMTVLAAAAGPAGLGRDRWAFYVTSVGDPEELTVTFHTGDGAEELKIPPTACLRNPNRLAGAAWFILPALGPRAKDVTSIQVGQTVTPFSPSAVEG